MKDYDHLVYLLWMITYVKRSFPLSIVQSFFMMHAIKCEIWEYGSTYVLPVVFSLGFCVFAPSFFCLFYPCFIYFNYLQSTEYRAVTILQSGTERQQGRSEERGHIDSHAWPHWPHDLSQQSAHNKQVVVYMYICVYVLRFYVVPLCTILAQMRQAHKKESIARDYFYILLLVHSYKYIYCAKDLPLTSAMNGVEKSLFPHLCTFPHPQNTIYCNVLQCI